MKNIIDNIMTFIITVLIIIISIGIVVFCLDVSGIIEVPEKYSLASMLYSNIEIRAASGTENYEKVITEDFDTIVKRSKEDKGKKVVTEPAETTGKSLSEIIEEVFSSEEDTQPVVVEEETNEIDARKFYYSQLDSYGKIIYDKLYSNKEKLRTGTYTADFGTTFNDLLHEDNGSDILNKSFQLAVNALTFDNPELFYIDITKVYLLTEITTRAFSKTYRVSVGPHEQSFLSDEFSSNDVARYSISTVEQCKNSIIAECESLSTVDKIRYVNNYLIDNTEYDLSAGTNVYNIYGTLIDRKAVCEGYARSVKYILDALDIPCIIACGIGKNSAGATESHAWNYVQVDGEWYALDVTWNDPVFKGGIGRLTDEMRYEYFLNGGNKFFEDHFEDGNIVGDTNFVYPRLNNLNYN